MFENLINPLLSPLLGMHPLFSLLILSFFISLIFSLAWHHFFQFYPGGIFRSTKLKTFTDYRLQKTISP